MKIKSVILKGFGKFNKGFAVSFDHPSNINIVIGRNESGKSTIASAIFGVLFGFPMPADQEKFQPWQGSDYWGAIHLASGVHEYRVEREFHRHAVKIKRLDALSGEETVLFDGIVSPRGKMNSDKEKYLNLLQEFFGFSDFNVFRSTVLISQNEIATLTDDETVGKIRQIIAGSLEVDYEKVLNTLKEQYFALTKSNPWGRDMLKNRRLEEIEHRIQELKDTLLEAQDALEKSKRIEAEKDELSTRLKQSQDELNHFQTLVTKVAEYRDLESAVGRLRDADAEYEEDLNAVITMRRKLVQLDEEYQDLQFMETLPEDFAETLNDLANLEDVAGDVESRHEAEKRRFEQYPKKHITFRVAAAVTAAGALIILSTLFNHLTIFALVFAVSIVGATAVIAREIWMKAMSNEQRQQINGRVQLLAEELESKRRQMTTLKNKLAACVPDGRLGDVDKLKKKHLLFQRLYQQRRELTMVLSKFSDEDTIRGRSERVKIELGSKHELLERFLANAPYARTCTPEEEEQHRRRVEATAIRCRDIEARLKGVEQEYWSVGSGHANIHVIEDELETLEAERAQLRRKADAIYMAITALMSAQARYQEKYLERFCDTISERFRAITHQRYERVDVAEDTLEPVVSSAEHRNIQIGSLSAGTQDQLYFAMRLAMMRYLTRNRSLPLILDDPFVNYDAERLATTRSLLETVARDNQVILFTHDRDYLAWQSPVYDFENVA